MSSGIVSDLRWYQKLSAVRSKLYLHEYENNTHEAEQALPAWRGAAGVVGARGRCCPPATVPVAVVWPCGVCCCIAENKQNFRTRPSTEKQSSAIIVHKPKRTATSTTTIHTRQKKPYRLGAVPAGVVWERSRCGPPAIVPAAVIFACGVRCCIAEIAEKKQS